MERFSIPALSFFELVVAPQFQDLAPGAQGFTGTLNEFTLMPGVTSTRRIIDIRRQQNIMQRRDASCDITYKNLFGTSNRKVTVDEIYAAVKFCRNEFYQGCLKDFRAQDPVFEQRIVPYFQKAVNIDLTTNAYFGDVNRADNPDAEFSVNQFDGIWKWIAAYTASNIITADKTIEIADGTDYNINPSDAFALIKALYDKMPQLMRASFTTDQLAIYVSPEIAQGYEDYLIAAGQGNIAYTTTVLNGLPYQQLAYKKIPILEQPLWSPVINQIKGSPGYAAILTLRGNFIFALDETYGEGPGGHQALVIWYDYEHMSWKWQMFMKVGTQIALPEFLIYAISDFLYTSA